MSEEIENVLIIGTGCAGLTAAIYTARANLNPLVIEGSQPGGQLTTTSEVENFPGFSKGVDGYGLTDEMRKQAKRFGARFTQGLIKEADFSGHPRILKTDSETYRARTVIIATGASPRLLGLESEKKLYGGGGVTTCATCDGAFYRDMDVAVVGGGDSACEEALFLTRFCSKVYLIHRRDELRASQIMQDRVLAEPKIEMVWNSLVDDILGADEGAVSGIRIIDRVKEEKREIPVKGVFIAIGHIPNTKPFANALPVDENGYLLPEGNSQIKTKLEGVYAAGDCVDHVYRQAITAAGMGCQAAIEAERWLAEKSF
ncbi:MAG: thioredoxin-disulfide reductase [Opitutales bacterium]|nr:thioredoxin-disulfide reductase [Opitutales bacterium]MCH8539616.1 thioredoxin-disulfide reductase [Opitutales bacterium]